jgi:alpha-1,2-mannosyltransferase
MKIPPSGTFGADLPARGKVKKEWLLLALAFPAVFINLGHGHNGFLPVALLAAAQVQFDRRPVLAGVLFACLAYKPQFGLLIPLMLARRRSPSSPPTACAAASALTKKPCWQCCGSCRW